MLLYWFVRNLMADRNVAITAVIFYLLVPAKLFFFPVLNTVTPVIVLGRPRPGPIPADAPAGLRRRFRCRGVRARVFDPLGLVMGLLFAALAVDVLREQEHPWRDFGALSAVAAGGFLAVYATLLVGFQFDFVTTFVTLASDASAFNTIAGRPDP